MLRLGTFLEQSKRKRFLRLVKDGVTRVPATIEDTMGMMTSGVERQELKPKADT